ncbi:MAG: replicative DNA helicase [bacterium]|nr:replicative DNA helicase [bacterium]
MIGDDKDLLSQRLPNNLEAERALLGGMILDNRQIDAVLDVLPSQAVAHALGKDGRRPGRAAAEPLFFSPAHQIIFGAVASLHEQGLGVDLTTLGEELLRRGQLESVGGAAALAGLEENIFSLRQVAQYAQIVVQKWRLRCLMRAALSIADEAAASEAPAQEVIDRAEKQIFDIAQEQQQRDFVHIGEAVSDQLQEIEQRAKGGGQLPGLATGFAELDRMTTGLRPSQLVILAARPSMGKSAFALNIATHVALKEGRPVGVYSLEMSTSELTLRLLATESHVPMGRVRGNHRLRRDELEAIHEAGERVARAPFHIDDASSLSILEIRSRSRRLKARCPDLALIVVDYLQLMHSGAARVESRQQEVSEISRALKGLSRELEIPIIALSQLSRQSEQRRGAKDKMPRLSDLRESGAIEQDADIVIFIHREKNMAVNPDAAPEPEIATVRIGKQRNGPVGDFELLFRGEFTEFVDLKPM